MAPLYLSWFFPFFKSRHSCDWWGVVDQVAGSTMALPLPQSKNQLLSAVDNLTYTQRHKYPLIEEVMLPTSLTSWSYAARLGRDNKDIPALRALVNELLKVWIKQTSNTLIFSHHRLFFILWSSRHIYSIIIYTASRSPCSRDGSRGGIQRDIACPADLNFQISTFLNIIILSLYWHLQYTTMKIS